MKNKIQLNWLLVVFIAVAVQGCSSPGGMLEEKPVTYNFGDGSSVNLVRTGCRISGVEVQTAKSKAATGVAILATDASKRTIGQWHFGCGATIAGGRTSCELRDESYDDNFMAYKGGFGCPLFDEHQLNVSFFY